MPILVASIRQAQQAGAQDGRIRPGTSATYQKRGGGEGIRPVKLETWRLTSTSREAIEAAAALWGGVPQIWQKPARGGDGGPRRGPQPAPEWEVITTTRELPVHLLPSNAVDQWMELWSGGRCVRRCTGPGGINQKTGDGCECPEDDRTRVALSRQNPPAACRPVSRLRVRLVDLPGVGVWRVDCGGYNGTVEQGGTIRTLDELLAGQPRLIAATLVLDWRTSPGAPGEPGHTFVVPRLIVPESESAILAQTRTMAELAAGRDRAPLGMPTSRPQITAGPAGPTAPQALPTTRPGLDPAGPTEYSPEQIINMIRRAVQDLNKIPAAAPDRVQQIRAVATKAGSFRFRLLDECLPEDLLPPGAPLTPLRAHILDLLAAEAQATPDPETATV
ncbi:recombination directionality factor [Parafrankia discariae]|uniref:recombination directionality factor n=1 Tax=Parafrankia discariae TaxID=365528 RepID=UPI0003687C42|nr:hypothetical protein [Parafrankia discariae]